MQHGTIRRLNLALLLAFVAVALILIYWSVIRANTLAARDDNPRVVEAQLRIRRGPILDRNGLVLAESVGEQRVTRRYDPVSGPAVGYYSVRFGASGVEQSLDAHLRGSDATFWQDFWRDLLHAPQVGRGVRLTLDADWQQAADAALTGQQGALVLLSLPDGAVRAIASKPNYDPNLLDSQFEELSQDERAPLLNRATQAQLQPGLVLQPFLLAQALSAGLDGLSETAPLTVDAAPPCAVDGVAQSYADAFRRGCPIPSLFRFDADMLSQTLAAWRLTTPVSLLPPLATTAQASQQAQITDLERALVGQADLTVTPLQVAVAWAALARQGEWQAPRLVAALQAEDGGYRTQTNGDDQQNLATPSAAAERVLELLSQGELIEYSALALAGPQGDTVVWYMALAPRSGPRFALLIAVENGDPAAVRAAGRDLLARVMR